MSVTKHEDIFPKRDGVFNHNRQTVPPQKRPKDSNSKYFSKQNRLSIKKEPFHKDSFFVFNRY